MGCDIHLYLEHVDKDRDRVDDIAKFSLGRDYFMFSLMAGVRSEDGSALFAPRGAPDDMGWRARGDYHVWPDENHSRETIEDWVRSGSSIWVDKERGRATHPDWHSTSWLTTAEMEQVKVAYEEREFARQSWYQATKTITPDRLAMIPGATMDDVTITPGESYYHADYYVEIGPKTKDVFPPGYAALLAAMQALGEGARIVFWFDN